MSVHAGTDNVSTAQGPLLGRDRDLAQLFDLVIQGDFVSLHLAADAGVDPGPIAALDYIKAGLARRE